MRAPANTNPPALAGPMLGDTGTGRSRFIAATTARHRSRIPTPATTRTGHLAKSRRTLAVGNRGRLWALVLAGGEGRRLQSLTRALYGTALPKQFAVLSGKLSLLQTTVERAACLVPLHRVMVVTCAAHEQLASKQLETYRGVELAVQPRNLDTAPGILLPLSRILSRDPSARVVILPSDHHLAAPDPFVEAIRLAADASRRESDGLTLLGAVPESPETEYGWIVPGPAFRDLHREVRRVERFVEKPPEALAQRLFEAGGLWNTFVSTGTASAYWTLASRHLPDLAAHLESNARIGDLTVAARALEVIYSRTAPVNFSRAILERARSLRVVPVAASGWSDWGSPQRVLRSLTGPALRTLLYRLGSTPSVAENEYGNTHTPIRNASIARGVEA